MRIEWNRVTWYSKLTAVVLFVSTFALGGYLGTEYQKIVDGTQMPNACFGGLKG